MLNIEENPKERKVEIKRLGRNGYLHAVIPVFDSSGKLIHRVVKPLMVELRLKDVIQIIVGATLLAIPMAFTEETWKLGNSLPNKNVAMLSFISIFFVSIFVYVHFYRYYLKGFVFQYIKRVISIYFISLLVVGILMTIIQQCPWGMDNILAVKRIIIVSLPASMSAVATDAIK